MMLHLHVFTILAAFVALAAQARAETRAVHAAGPCSLAGKDNVGNNYFQADLSGRMNYELRVRGSVRMTDGIGVVLHVSNPTERPLYFRCDLAFFDKQDGLVGCTSWEQLSPLAAGTTNRQFSPTTADVPAARIDDVAKFQAVVYESDRAPGVEPADTKASAALPGEKAPAIIRLTDAKQETLDAKSYARFRALAQCSFHDATDENADDALPIGPGTAYELRVSPRLYEDIVTQGIGPKRKVKKIRRWRFDAYLVVDEKGPAPKGSLFYVLLDAEGKLLTAGMSGRRIDFPATSGVPKDLLFSATTLEAVIYRPAP